jgi:hypothetical protein
MTIDAQPVKGLDALKKCKHALSYIYTNALFWKRKTNVEPHHVFITPRPQLGMEILLCFVNIEWFGAWR